MNPTSPSPGPHRAGPLSENDEREADSPTAEPPKANEVPQGMNSGVSIPKSVEETTPRRQDRPVDLVLLAFDPTDDRGQAVIERLRDVIGPAPLVLVPPYHPEATRVATALPAVGTSGRATPHVRPATVDAWLGSAPMRASIPHVHDDLVESVADLHVLAASAGDDAASAIKPHLPPLVARLAMLTATPGDVAAIVRSALVRCADMPAPKDRVTWEDLSGNILITLLGGLCEQYMKDALDEPRSRRPAPSDTEA